MGDRATPVGVLVAEGFDPAGHRLMFGENGIR
jgi:hypothetical protein